ncbi:MAG: sugar transferase [Propionibacterium sp.]|nr:sugar transferase [Propionibacterium sp.]
MTALQRRPTVPEEPPAPPGDHGHASQVRAFQGVLAAGDFVVITLSVTAGHLLKFGFNDPSIQDSNGIVSLSYLPLSIGLGLAWWLLLGAFHTYRQRLLGTGTEEYQRVFQATFLVFGALAIASYLFKVQVARGYFLAVLPIGLLGLFLWRWVARKRLVHLRRRGELISRVLLLGGAQTAADMARELRRRRDLGMSVVGACVAGPNPGRVLRGSSVPVLGGAGDMAAVLEQLDVDTLVVTGSPDLSAQEVRRLSWELDPARVNLILAPSIVDVAGPRINLRPVDGLSLVEVAIPRFDGSKLVLKRAFDLFSILCLSVIVVPVGLIVAACIKLDDGGPVFFRQARVGLGGSEFRMWKFRSMRTDAEQVLDQLRRKQGLQDAGNEVLFKMKDDPRVTPVGRVIRALSLDEVPQLINVLTGEMSLVGPRPPLPREVTSYEADVMRKFMVKPGITGLWQVSGRSELSWEDSVRLDLYYVENWSLTEDIRILFRTVKVVLARDGAY